MGSHPYTRFEDLVRLRHAAGGFSLLPKQPVSSLLSGQHASRLRGRGMMFEELRDYRPGDDIRQMDWKATARLRKPYIRVYSEERERTVLLVVDQRTSMFFGSERTTKATAAAEVAALAAWRAIDGGDRIGAIVFGDDETLELRPRRSRESVLHICHEITRMNQQLSADQLAEDSSRRLNDALRQCVNVAKHDCLVVLVTDYAGDDDETRRLTTQLASHNDVLAFLVYDPLGIRLPARGQLHATDGSTQYSIPSGPEFAQSFETSFRARCDQLRERLGAIRVPIVPICTHEPVARQILAAMGERP
ncbi:DUF58 domain-containing protein [Allorhodopirellula heiligendammensis]|uniref:DUF58 domain-containing protein n=1 Tax=Allorhodopirellula heiligendammensis TaxID=2714739 RepID=A0A5C6BE48_9BACT|nr:DUF58 domain-containing protein [Allorhodopirellula heiligendammensis]TWU10465.1 hypothetical protein Poly21_43690 [Allorhodopirellula heiligendammensis]